MRIRIIESIGALEPYLHVWHEILAENNNTNPFLTPEWIVSWWKFFGNGRKLCIMAAMEDERAMGFCPLMITEKCLCRSIEFVGHPHAARMGFVIRRGHETPFVQLIMDQLTHDKSNALISLHGINHDDPCGHELMQALHGRLVNVTSMPDYFVTLGGTDSAAYFKDRAHHHAIKKTISREKALSKLIDLRLVKADPDETEVIFPLHQKHWRRKNDNNGFGKDIQREFFAYLAKETNFSSFHTSVYLLKAGTALIAFLYGLECNGRFTSYRLAHDDDFALYRPGMIAKKRVLMDCFSRGIQTMDFLPGDEQHKKEWTDEVEWIDRIEFGTRMGMTSFILCLHRWMHMIRMLAKRNRLLWRIKHEAIGQIRYILSGTPLLLLLKKTVHVIQQHRFKNIPYALMESFSGELAGKLRPFTAEPVHSGVQSKPCITMYTAKLDEAFMLSELTNLNAALVVERYFKGSECQVMIMDGHPVGYAWLCGTELRRKDKILWHPVDPGDRCIYGICVFRPYQSLLGEILTCLIKQLLPKNCHTLHILVRDSDRKLIRLMEGFSRQPYTNHPSDAWHSGSDTVLLTAAKHPKDA